MNDTLKRPRLVVDINKINVVEVRGVTQPKKNIKDDQQRHQRVFFDDLVREAYDAWVDEGRPTDLSDRPGRGLEIDDDPATIQNVKKLIRASADRLSEKFDLGIGIRFGEVRHLSRKRARVEFTAQDRKIYHRPTSRKSS